MAEAAGGELERWKGRFAASDFVFRPAPNAFLAAHLADGRWRELASYRAFTNSRLAEGGHSCRMFQGRNRAERGGQYELIERRMLTRSRVSAPGLGIESQR